MDKSIIIRLYSYVKLIYRLVDCSYGCDCFVEYSQKGANIYGIGLFRNWQTNCTTEKELGLKQTEVCKRAGINDKYLSCIERATSIPSLEVVMRLALALDTTPDEFLTGRFCRWKHGADAKSAPTFYPSKREIYL